jgi:(2R)-3-sulfolactate dehydrogenase (NADP+)
MPIVKIDQIEQVVQAALEHHGAAPWVAAHVARATARSEAFGNKICGLYYVESYCQQLRSGRVRGDVEPVVTRPRGAHVRVDAGFGFAQPAFSRGLQTAVAATKELGTVSFAVSHAHTCTSLGYFTEQIAAQGLIGIGFTNASPIVAAPGGKARVIGTNPIAFSVPAVGDAPGLHFDFSTSAVALGKITMARAAGTSIPLGWALDETGAPTTDPEAALKGALVSAGGHKGWGIGLMVEVLVAGLTGGVNSVDVKPLKAPEGTPHDLGQFYLLIDPGLSPDFAPRLERLAQVVAEDPGARLPGAQRIAATQVDVTETVWAQMLALSSGR